MEHRISSRERLFSVVCATFFSLLWFSIPMSVAANDVFDDEQSGSLRESLGLEGGYLEEMDQDSAGNLYAAFMAPNGLWCSDNAGTTWKAIDSGMDVGDGHSIATPADNIALAVAGVALYRTEDTCDTWTLLDDTGDYDQTSMLAHDGLVMIPKRNGQIAVTEDNGDTINAYDVSGDPGDTIVSIAASPTANTFFILTGEGTKGQNHIYKSLDRGQTWTSLGVTVEADVIAVDPTNANVLIVAGDDGSLRSTDGGATWTDMNALNQMPSPLVRGHITFSPSGRIHIGPQYTDNNGTSWSMLSSGATSMDSFLEGNAMLYDVNYATNNTIWFRCGRGPCVSTDNGVTWTDKIGDLLAVTILDISQDASKEVVWMAAQGGFVKSENFYSSVSAGVDPTWEFPIYPDAASGGVSNISPTSAVWVDPDNTDIVLAAWPQQLYRSADGGVTWTDISIDIQAEDQGTITSFVEDSAGNIYAGYKYDEGDVAEGEETIGGGVYVSADAGVTWTDTALVNAPVRALEVDGSDNVLAGVGSEIDETYTKRGLYFYDVPAATWTHISADSAHKTYGEYVADIEYIAANDRMVIVTGDTDTGGVFTSKDSSNDWELWREIGSGLPSEFWGRSVTNDPSGSHSVYVSTGRPAGSGEIYKCTAGSGCSLYYTGLVDEQFNTLLFDGLLSGSSLGVFSYQSKLIFTLAKKEVKKGENKGKIRLTATLKDAASDRGLNQRVVKFYVKNKKTGKFTFFKKDRVEKGQAKIIVAYAAKSRWYEARFKPKTNADLETYGSELQKSNVVKVKE